MNLNAGFLWIYQSANRHITSTILEKIPTRLIPTNIKIPPQIENVWMNRVLPDRKCHECEDADSHAGTAQKNAETIQRGVDLWGDLNNKGCFGKGSSG